MTKLGTSYTNTTGAARSTASVGISRALLSYLRPLTAAPSPAHGLAVPVANRTIRTPEKEAKLLDALRERPVLTSALKRARIGRRTYYN